MALMALDDERLSKERQHKSDLDVLRAEFAEVTEKLGERKEAVGRLELAASASGSRACRQSTSCCERDRGGTT